MLSDYLLNFIDRIFSDALNDLPDTDQVCFVNHVCFSPSSMEYWCKNCGSTEFYQIIHGGNQGQNVADVAGMDEKDRKV